MTKHFDFVISPSSRTRIAAVFLFFLLLINQVDVWASDGISTSKKSAVDVLVSELDHEFARGTIISIQMAERALNKLEQVQTQVQDLLQSKEIACHEDFFTNSCLQDVRLKRRQLQETLRQISIEAKSFIRRARVAKTQSNEDQPSN